MDYNLSSEYNKQLDRWDVSVSGEIDLFNSAQLKESLIELIKKKQADINIDCAELLYLDSTALGSLVAVLKSVKEYDGEVSISNLKPALTRLFKITKLDNAFVIVPPAEPKDVLKEVGKNE
ncbi:hypothetical protein FACS189490_01350 [Clostridia bacterium]|nr:hypothetical protein FACS189490_01350 [Clostridia bacterium]